MTNGDTTIKTGGGAATGNVQTSGGDFVGRDQINFIVPLGNWEDVRRLLFKDPTRPVTKSIQEQFQSFDWTKAEQAYLDKVIKLYDRVRILGSSADVPLGNLFTQVYILDKPTARYRHDIEELRKQSREYNEFQRQPGQRRHGLDLVKQGQNLFILGKPGAGKTTFLKYITVQAARKQLPRIPIFVSLNQWADSGWGKGNKAALLPFLVEQFDICDFPNADLFLDYLLRAGRALVLFDGLDEVKQEKDQRRRLTLLLQDFARKYDQSQHLITCRIAASDYVFDGFVDVEVADFTPDQVQEYARNWFGEHEKKFAAFTTELGKPENKGIVELCNIPLLLSLLCLTFDNVMRFPLNRAELYEDALETLLRKWDSHRQIQRDEIYRLLSHKRKLQLLMHIAIPTFEKGELFFRQRDLEQRIATYLTTLPSAPSADNLDGTTILKAIEAQHSILVERAQGIYSFSHLTFHEYLTARTLAENQGKEVIEKLIRVHLTDQRWREVFLLTASLLADADGFVNALCQTINGIIASAPNLILSLLGWAHEHTQQANAPVERRHIVQLAYISLALARSSAGDPDRDREYALASDQTFALTLVNDWSRNLDRTRERVIALASAIGVDLTLSIEFTRSLRLDLALDWALSRVVEIAQETAPRVGFDYGLYYAWLCAKLFANERLEQAGKTWQGATQEFPSLIQGVAELAHRGELAGLAQQLVTKSIPHPNVRARDWWQYAAVLSTILDHERNLGDEWTLSGEEIKTLNDYLYANELLVQCLKVAAISDRQAVLQKLLLPPGI